MKTKQEDKTMYFIYSEDGKQYIDTCIGIKQLSYFLNRQSYRVKKDLENIKRKRIFENKLIKSKQGLKFIIISEKDKQGLKFIIISKENMQIGR